MFNAWKSDVPNTLGKICPCLKLWSSKWKVLIWTHPEQLDKGSTLKRMNFDSAKCNVCNWGKVHCSNVRFVIVILVFAAVENLQRHDEMNGKNLTTWEISEELFQHRPTRIHNRNAKYALVRLIACIVKKKIVQKDFDSSSPGYSKSFSKRGCYSRRNFGLGLIQKQLCKVLLQSIEVKISIVLSFVLQIHSSLKS